MLVKCRVKIVNNRVVCDNEKKLSEKIEHKKEIIEGGFGYIKNKDKLKHLLDIGVDLDKYHPSILRVVCDSGRDSKLTEMIKPQLEMIARESEEKGFIPSAFGYNNKLHKTIKRISNKPKRKYIKKIINNKTPKKVVEKPNEPIKIEGGHLTDIDDVLSEIESDIEAGELSEAETKIKRIKTRIPSKVYKKIMSTLRS
jgi:hypothetical protein